MKVILFNVIGQAKYIPVRKIRNCADYNVVENIMPKYLYRKLKKYINEKRKENRCSPANWDLPVHVFSKNIEKSGCKLIELSRKKYESVKCELVKG